MDLEYKKKLISFKHMLILTIPIFIELLLQMVIGYSDQIMMSKWENAVNGITNANVVINMVINVFSVFGAASIILITQYRGAHDKKRENEIYSAAFYLNGILSLFFALIIIFFSRYYLRWLQTPSNAYNDALIYSMIVGISVFFQALASTLSCFLKSNNLMKESMITNLIINIINVGGNFILINLFNKIGYPIIGVALSSTISRFIYFLILLFIYHKKIGVKLSFKDFLNHKKARQMIIKVGGPSGGESVSYNSSQIIIQLVVNQIVIYASNNVGIGNIKTYAAMFAMVTYMFTSAISQAMQVIIGELLGAGEIEDTKKTVKRTILISIFASETIALIFFLTSNYIFRIFHVTDPQLLSLAKKIMGIEIALELGRAFNICYVRALQTSGDVMFPTISAVIFCWLVAVLGSFILGSPYILNLGLVGVWIAMALDECIRAIIFVVRFKMGKWKKMNLAKR